MPGLSDLRLGPPNLVCRPALAVPGGRNDVKQVTTFPPRLSPGLASRRQVRRRGGPISRPAVGSPRYPVSPTPVTRWSGRIGPGRLGRSRPRGGCTRSATPGDVRVEGIPIWSAEGGPHPVGTSRRAMNYRRGHRPSPLPRSVVRVSIASEPFGGRHQTTPLPSPRVRQGDQRPLLDINYPAPQSRPETRSENGPE